MAGLAGNTYIGSALTRDDVKQAQAVLHRIYLKEVHRDIPSTHPQGLREVIDADYGKLLIDDYVESQHWLVVKDVGRVVGALCCITGLNAQGMHYLQHYVKNWQALNQADANALQQSIGLGRLVMLPAFRHRHLVRQLVCASYRFCAQQQRPALAMGLQQKNVNFLHHVGLQEITEAELIGVFPETRFFIAYPDRSPQLTLLAEQLQR